MKNEIFQKGTVFRSHGPYVPTCMILFAQGEIP